MGKPLIVEICAGTACYVRGGAELLGALDTLPTELVGKVEWRGSPCMGLCKGLKAAPPYARVGGVVLSEASPEELLTAIERGLGCAQGGALGGAADPSGSASLGGAEGQSCVSDKSGSGTVV